MKLLPKLFLLIVVLVLLRLAVGLGSAAFHYSNTQTYNDYLENHAVSPEYFQQQVSLPTAIHSGKEWQQGAVAADDESGNDEVYVAGMEFQVDIEHGEDLMLRLNQKVEYLISSQSNDHLGFRWTTEDLRVGTNLRAMVLIWLDDDALKIGPDSASKGQATIDVFLLAGADRSRIQFLNLADRDEAYAKQTLGLPVLPNLTGTDPSAGMPLWRLATGIANHFGEPPTEGLIHFSSQSVGFGWKKDGRNFSSAGHYRPRFYANTDEYSYRKSFATTSSMDRSHSHTSSTEVSRTQKWKDRIW